MFKFIRKHYIDIAVIIAMIIARIIIVLTLLHIIKQINTTKQILDMNLSILRMDGWFGILFGASIAWCVTWHFAKQEKKHFEKAINTQTSIQTIMSKCEKHNINYSIMTSYDLYIFYPLMKHLVEKSGWNDKDGYSFSDKSEFSFGYEIRDKDKIFKVNKDITYKKFNTLITKTWQGLFSHDNKKKQLKPTKASLELYFLLKSISNYTQYIPTSFGFITLNSKILKWHIIKDKQIIEILYPLNQIQNNLSEIDKIKDNETVLGTEHMCFLLSTCH